MAILGETARNSVLKFRRFISMIFLSTSVALNILSLHQLFRDFENFMSLFGRFRFWEPTRFPEVICLRYDPDLSSSPIFQHKISI